MKIDFCGMCTIGHDYDEDGLCARHGVPVRGAQVKCVHCTFDYTEIISAAVEVRGAQVKCVHCTRAETIAYGDACPQCGNPAVGEAGEPALVLERDAEAVDSNEDDGCGCRLERDMTNGTVRLFMCKTHRRAKDLENSFDEVCAQMGCEVDAIPEKFVQVCAERDKALGALCIDDELEGDKLTEAIERADQEFGAAAQSYRPAAEKLLQLTGLTEAEWLGGSGLSQYYECRFDPVEFLVSRLRALAPDKLAKELRPKSPRARRGKKTKSVETKSPEGEEEGPRLRLVGR